MAFIWSVKWPWIYCRLFMLFCFIFLVTSIDWFMELTSFSSMEMPLIHCHIWEFGSLRYRFCMCVLWKGDFFYISFKQSDSGFWRETDGSCFSIFHCQTKISLTTALWRPENRVAGEQELMFRFTKGHLSYFMGAGAQKQIWNKFMWQAPGRQHF